MFQHSTPIRVTSVALALLLSTAVTSCSSSASNKMKLDPKNPISISVWNYYNGPQKISFDKLVTEFNDSMGIEKGIVVEAFSQGSIEELTQKLIASAEKKVGADETPNIFAAYADTAFEIDKLGLVTELNQYLTKTELDAYQEEYWMEGVLGESKFYKIFPIAKSTEIFMLNQTDWEKFAQATGASTSQLATMEGVVKTAENYYNWTDSQTEAPDDGKAFFGRDALANYMIIGYRQLGTELFEVENGTVKLNLDPSIMRKLWDNYYLPFISGHFKSNGKFRSDDIKTGDIISLIGSTSGATYFPDKVVLNDLDSYDITTVALPLPVFEGGEKVTVQQGAGMVVTKSNPKAETASVEFLKWFTDAERNLDFSLDSGYMPVMKVAKTKEALDSAFTRIGKENIAPTLLSALPVAIADMSGYLPYTTQAFDGGSDARYAVQDAIVNKSQQDLEKVNALVASGISRTDAVAQFNTDENFRAWYANLESALKAIVS